MRKIVPVLTIFISIFLVACEEEIPVEIDKEIDELIEILPEDLITMETLDDYMGRTDVQYVDLRNMEAKFRSGFIQGFELIPFFDYLDYRAFIRDDNYDFEPDQIVNEDILRTLFDEDKAIFLYADGCIRSNYIRDALLYLGYERVYVLGGYYEYEGDYNVLGDGEFALGTTEYETYTIQDGTTYHVSVIYDLGRMILDIRFDITDPDGISYRSTGYSEIDYNEQLTILEEFIVSDLITSYRLIEFITSTEDNKYHNIQGYTLDYSDEMLILIGKIGNN